SSTRGMATMIWETGSGGVTTAATTRITTREWRRYLIMNSGVRMPTRERAQLTMGSWKMMPQAMIHIVSELKYSLMSKSLRTYSEMVNCMKNCSANGVRIRYPKATPNMKRSVMNSVTKRVFLRSFDSRAGSMNAQ